MRRADATRVWYLMQGGSALGGTLVWVLAPVYFVKTVGMSPLQLVLVGTFMELSVFVFELPTGIVADVYSRRLSTIVGYLIMGVAMVFVGLTAEAWAIIFGWAVWGFGYTFTSGAEDAWLADEIGVDNVRPVYLRSAQLGRAVALLGIAATVALGLVALWLPIVVGGCVFAAVGVVLAASMPETGFKRAERGQAETALRVIVRTGVTGARLVRRTPVLLLLLAISVAQPANHRLEQAGQRTVTWILLALDVVLIASVVVFGLAGLFWLAVGAMLLTNVARSLAMPLFTS